MHPIHFDEHSRGKPTPRKIADRPLVDVIDFSELAFATRTLDLPLPPLAADPQLQRLGFFFNLVLVNPIPGPI